MPINDALDFGIPHKIYTMHEKRAEANDRARGPRTVSSSFWASELGKCGRQIGYSKTGDFAAESPSGRSHRIFRMGDTIEATLVQELRDSGFSVQFSGTAQKRITVTHPPISGRIDGVISGVIAREKVTRLLELKSMNTRGFAELKSKGLQKSQPGYYTQIQVYLFALHLDEATILVEDKNTQELYEETVVFDPLHVADRFLWLQYVQNCVAAEKLPEPEYPKSSWQCRYCAYSDHCPGLPEPERKPGGRVARVAKGA